MKDDIEYAISSTKSYLWSDSLGRLELEIPAAAVEDIARQGDSEPAVKAWLEGPETNYLRAQVEGLSECGMREVLEDAGIEDVESRDEEEVQRVILWMACHDIKEEANQPE